MNPVQRANLAQLLLAAIPLFLSLSITMLTWQKVKRRMLLLVSSFFLLLGVASIAFDLLFRWFQAEHSQVAYNFDLLLGVSNLVSFAICIPIVFWLYVALRRA